MRKADVYYRNTIAGELIENEDGYTFRYLKEYLSDEKSEPISLNFPLREKAFFSKALFPFFDGLIPEGWLLNIAVNNWKIDANDRFSLLTTCCKDCIGAVGVVGATN